MNEDRQGSTKWDFWLGAFKIGLPLALFVALFLLARDGDVAAIVALSAVAVLLLLALGAIIVLAVVDRLHKIEQMRFNANVKENLAIMEMTQRIQQNQIMVQSRQSRDLLLQNERLARMLPTANGQESEIEALAWDDAALRDLED